MFSYELTNDDVLIIDIDANGIMHSLAIKDHQEVFTVLYDNLNDIGNDQPLMNITLYESKGIKIGFGHRNFGIMLAKKKFKTTTLIPTSRAVFDSFRDMVSRYIEESV